MDAQETDIMAKLPSLDPEALLRVRTRADFLLAGQGAKDGTREELLYAAICEAVNGVTGRRRPHPPYSVFIKTFGPEKSKTAAGSFISFLNEAFSASRQLDWYAATCVIMEAAARWMLRAQIGPVTVKRFYDLHDRIEDIVDQEFPGYAAAGVLGRVQRRG